MPIVDPEPIWKVDHARDRAKAEFSHGLSLELPFGPANARALHG
ncbi:MAG: hypothetical protein Q8K96_00700 [Rubrivivax sp.]|nr:hypothetical protein [Rubrivivax sp.]